MEHSPSIKYLADWFVRYIKNRDVTFRKISEIHEDEDLVTVSEKSGKKTIYKVIPFPDDFTAVAIAIEEEHKGIIVYNSRENFDKLISSWKKLIKMPSLVIYFINPFSKLDKRWIIRPSVHARISDEESLEQGLTSMFQMVGQISKKEIEQLTS